MPLLPTLFVLAIASFQGWVTWRVWKDEVFLRAEKAAQLKLIWLLPLLGAVMVYSVLSEESDHHGGPPTHWRG